MARTLAGEIAKARSEEVSASALSMSTDVQGGSPPTEASQSTGQYGRVHVLIQLHLTILSIQQRSEKGGQMTQSLRMQPQLRGII